MSFFSMEAFGVKPPPLSVSPGLLLLISCLSVFFMTGTIAIVDDQEMRGVQIVIVLFYSLPLLKLFLQDFKPVGWITTLTCLFILGFSFLSPLGVLVERVNVLFNGNQDIFSPVIYIMVVTIGSVPILYYIIKSIFTSKP